MAISLLRKVNQGISIDESERSELLGLCQAKSSVIRRLAVTAVNALVERGELAEESARSFLRASFNKDAAEDLRFMRRALNRHPDFISEVIRCCAVTCSSAERQLDGTCYLEYVDKGFNKQIYRAALFSGGNCHDFVISTIREGPGTAGLDHEHLESGVALWRKLSEAGIAHVPRLGSCCWFLDYSPRVLDEPIIKLRDFNPMPVPFFTTTIF